MLTWLNTRGIDCRDVTTIGALIGIMNISIVGASLVIGVALSWLLTALLRRYALATQLIDLPNARSSHTVPTPRGGGVAIVLTFLLLTSALGAKGLIEKRLLIALIGAGLLVAVLGFLDDRAHMSARWRFLGHAAAAVWVVVWMESIPAVPLLGQLIDLGIWATLLSVFYLTWMVNLFNFMDGIDGIASVEAITAALGGALVWWLAGAGTGWVLALVFAACVGGFLIWNFPPARIFMGDAGSGFLGLVVGLLSLWCGQAAPHLFWAWFILIGCFMVDGTTTLVRRVLRREKFNEAHHSHAYQYAARQAGRHLPVTLAVVVINVVWLLPLAVAVALGWLDGLTGVAVAYAPLLWLAFHYKAGARELQKT
jgi:Fuc2NAc and GlcNAc transferase